MKQPFFIATLLLFFFSTTYCQTDTVTNAAQRKVMQFERDLVKANLAGDSAKIDKFYAKDYRGSMDGRFEDKERVLRNIDPEPDVTIKDLFMKVRVYGNSAVVDGVWEIKIKDRKTLYSDFTDMLIWQKEGWTIVADHQSLIPAWMVRDLEDSEFVAITSQSCETESSLKSLNSDVSTFVRFKNNTSDSITVQWINYSGERDKSPYQKHSVAAGKDVSLQTYMTHPFIVMGTKGKCYGIYLATSSPSIAVITN